MRRAFVTGVSRGLGAHLARHLAADGWEVAGVSRSGPRDEEPFRHVAHDLARSDGVEDLVHIAVGEQGCPDLVVLNAVTYPDADAADPVAEAERVMRVNALVPYLFGQALLRTIDATRPTTVVVLNSESMFHADATSGVYPASKAALRVLTTSLAAQARESASCVATLLLGPLANEEKVRDLRKVATSRNVTEEDITRTFLRRSNPDLVIDRLIDFDVCARTVQHLAGLGHVGNGTVCRIDGGSAGSLV